MPVETDFASVLEPNVALLILCKCQVSQAVLVEPGAHSPDGTESV